MGAVNSVQVGATEGHPPQKKTVLPLRKNLIFPNEILEKIISFLSFRDRLICREVCTDWLHYVDIGGDLQHLVKVKVSSDELNYLADSEPIFTRFHFHKVDLTRQSSKFWNVYSDTITHLDFYDCAVIPRNTADSKQVEFTLGCPNLKHLGLINCDKYFLMGGRFIQLSEILCLENLESLNLSRNKNLTDNILFSILLKTKKLRSIDLSDCVNMVYMKAVHNRFYRAGQKIEEIDTIPSFSDHILSFHTFCTHFLQTTRARQMKNFNFGMKLNTIGMNLILDCENISWECVNLESPELKPSDLKSFMEKYRSSLRSVRLGRCKLTSDEICAANLESLEELELHDSRSIISLSFLVNMPNLKKLLLDGLNGFHFQNEAFSNFRNLSDLSLNGIKPDGNLETCRDELISSFKHLRNLTALDIGNAPYIVNDDVTQAVVRNLKRLKRLNLESSNITDLGMAGCQNVHDSNNEHVPNAGVSAILSELYDLEHLNVSHCRDLGEITWQKAIRFQNLISLNLSSCPTLSKKGLLSIINNCRNIEQLVLIHCPRQILTDSDVLAAAREKLYRCKEITY